MLPTQKSTLTFATTHGPSTSYGHTGAFPVLGTAPTTCGPATYG